MTHFLELPLQGEEERIPVRLETLLLLPRRGTLTAIQTSPTRRRWLRLRRQRIQINAW